MRGEIQEGSDDASKEWSGKSIGELEEPATEEKSTNTGRGGVGKG